MSIDISVLGILGAGTMGTGIAQVAAQADLEVRLVDVSAEALQRSRERLSRSVQESLQREKLTPAQAERIPRLISWDLVPEHLADADWVIEATVEDLQVKEQALRQIAALLPEDVPLASNTSSFSIKHLAEVSGRPQRFLGMHFFNPPPAMKLVEIIPTERTLMAVVDAALALCTRLGKTPLVVPDVPGFVVNRGFAALVSAALELWDQGAPPESIDQALEMGLGHRMGPLRTADLVGLDIMLALLNSLHEQTGHPRFSVPERFVALVQSGRLGKKTGEGFYRYED